MRYEDQKLLLAWAKLQFQIARAKCQLDAVNMTEGQITHSLGYKKLRAWFMGLSDRAKVGARRFMTMQISGVKQLLEQATASGEKIEYGDIVIETFDDAGAPVQPVELEPAADACQASGVGIAGVERMADGDYVKCPMCLQRWEAHTIGFKIPNHEALDA